MSDKTKTPEAESMTPDERTIERLVRERDEAREKLSECASLLRCQLQIGKEFVRERNLYLTAWRNRKDRLRRMVRIALRYRRQRDFARMEANWAARREHRAERQRIEMRGKLAECQGQLYRGRKVEG